jgi:predicted nucleic acid-binding protein
VYVLDNNTVRAVLRNPTAYLEEQIRQYPGQVFISVVVVEEMIRGVMSELNRNMRRPEIVQHYNFLRSLVADLNLFPILPYDAVAEELFQSFSPAIKRVGLRDCRIAASAMTQRPEQFIVVTRNLDDFQAIGARCVNWIDRPTNNTT